MLTRRQIHSLGVVTTLLASVSCSDDATVSTDPPMEPELEWTTHVIHDYEFAGLQYFFLRDPEGCPWEIDEASLQLFVDNQNPGDDPYRGAIEATATPDGEPPVPEEDDAHAGRYHPLFYGSEFMIQTHIYVGQPVLILTRPLDPDDYLAAVFRGWELEWSGTEWIRGERIEIGIYGDPKTAPTLKMIRASDDDRRVDETDLRAGTWGNTSRLELRNVYDLSARNLRGLELSIHIKRTIGSEVAPDDLDDGTTLLSLTALDLSRRTEQGTVPGFDNQVDEEFLDLRRGRLIFPISTRSIQIAQISASCLD